METWLNGDMHINVKYLLDGGGCMVACSDDDIQYSMDDTQDHVHTLRPYTMQNSIDGYSNACLSIDGSSHTDSTVVAKDLGNSVFVVVANLFAITVRYNA